MEKPTQLEKWTEKAMYEAQFTQKSDSVEHKRRTFKECSHGTFPCIESAFGIRGLKKAANMVNIIHAFNKSSQMWFSQ